MLPYLGDGRDHVLMAKGVLIEAQRQSFPLRPLQQLGPVHCRKRSAHHLEQRPIADAGLLRDGAKALALQLATQKHCTDYQIVSN